MIQITIFCRYWSIEFHGFFYQNFFFENYACIVWVQSAVHCKLNIVLLLPKSRQLILPIICTSILLDIKQVQNIYFFSIIFPYAVSPSYQRTIIQILTLIRLHLRFHSSVVIGWILTRIFEILLKDCMTVQRNEKCPKVRPSFQFFQYYGHF